MDAIPYLDTHVEEYLIFRGYIKTYTTFINERSQDKAISASVIPLADQLLTHVRKLDIEGFSKLWATLESRFFRHLPGDFKPTIEMLENSLKKAFLVKASKTGQKKLLTHLFDRFAEEPELTRPGSQWESWFLLPYIKDPSTHPKFGGFFNKRWFATLAISLKNFLSTVLDHLPLPKLLNFNNERLERKNDKAQIRSLKQMNSELRAKLQLTTDQLQTLRDNGYRVYEPQLDKMMGALPSTTPAPKTPSRVVETAPDQAESVDYNQTKGLEAIAKETNVPFFVQTQEVLLGHNAPITQAKFSQDGSKVATGAKDGNVRIWHLQYETPPISPSHLINSKNTESNYQNTSLTQSATTTQKDKNNQSSSLSRSERVEESNSLLLEQMTTNVRKKEGKVSTILHGADILSLEWDANDNYLMFGASDAKIKLWDVAQEKIVCEMKVPKECPRVLDLASSSRDPIFVSSSASKYYDSMEGGKGILQCWDLESGKARSTQTFHVESIVSQINSVIFNHNGNMLVTGGADGMIRVFDMVTYRGIMAWFGHEGQVSHVNFSSDETTVMSCGLDGKIQEWSLHRVGKVMRSFELQNADSYARWPVTRCQLAIDNKMEHFIVSGSDDENCAFFYHVSQSSPVQQLRGHSGPVISVDWHPSLNIVLTGSADHTARLSTLVQKADWYSALSVIHNGVNADTVEENHTGATATDSKYNDDGSQILNDTQTSVQEKSVI